MKSHHSFRWALGVLGLAAILVLVGLADLAAAQGKAPPSQPPREQPAVQPRQPTQVLPKAVEGAYYSHRLKAEFVIQNVYLPGWGSFPAARIVSMPAMNSPLHRIGLTMGDVIYRLDGIPIMYNYRELDNHYAWTQVRFIKAGSSYRQTGWIYIPTYGPGPVPPVPVPGTPVPGSPAPGSLGSAP